MFSSTKSNSVPESKSALYARLHSELAAVFAGERDFLANAANCAAVLYQSLPDVNWTGFYFLRGADLVLGPFQGKPACTRIGPGRGVCGATVQQKQTIIVRDVHQFPDHIACDSASRSEIVVPLVKADRLIGVLDLDSPGIGRFDEADRTGLEAIAATLISGSDLD